MNRPTPSGVELGIARCRLLLSVTVAVTLIGRAVGAHLGWLDPDLGAFDAPMRACVLLGLHLAYSASMYYGFVRQPRFPERLAALSTWNDIIFAATMALINRSSGPFLVLFIFALTAAAFRSGWRPTLFVTAVGLGMYWLVIHQAVGLRIDVDVWSVAYLGMIGCIFGWFGQQHLDSKVRLSAAAAADQRNRIARDLHDGCVQSIGALNLQLATCAEMLRRGHTEEVIYKLNELRGAVNIEHDNLRNFMRELAGVPETELNPATEPETRFTVRADFSGSGYMVTQVMQIVREGVVNVLRHAHAQSAVIDIEGEEPRVVITMNDDGVGFANEARRPWTIAARVAELNGSLKIGRNGEQGARLQINLA